jgi:streptogrisin C
VGFTVGDGFVTAGHCGDVGDTTTSPDGSFVGSSFPGDDYAYVRTASGNTLIGAVNTYSGTTVGVAGSTAAPVGASVCRSGSTTGWHCGTIQAYDATVTYAQGTVYGLIRTDVCAEPGDSGGSLLAGDQAQGVTSGGSGDCTSGGTTYFQPVNEILNAYGLTLRTDSGGSTTTCTGYERTATSSLSDGQAAATKAFSAASGTHTGCLDGPSGADFDLYLQKYSSGAWQTVAQGITTSADELVSYTGTSGTYRWLVRSYSGSGSFTLGWNVP